MAELSPLLVKPEYWASIERELREHLKRKIYLPLVDSLQEDHDELNAVKNSAYDDLLRAIETGQIQYIHGHFEGRFSATLSRALKGLGATWEKSQGRWKLPRSLFTDDMRSAVGTSSSRFEQKLARLDSTIRTIAPKQVADQLQVSRLIDRTLFKVERDFQSSVRKLGVQPEFTDKMKKALIDQYALNLKLKIQGWTEDEVVSLRKQVMLTAFQGNRYESMLKMIQTSYGVSQNKARFLARQETNLLMSSYRRARYESAGITKYRWKCVHGSPNHPVRPMHQRLDGTIQLWSSPPVVDNKGNRKHPGEDYECRCIAIPIAAPL